MVCHSLNDRVGACIAVRVLRSTMLSAYWADPQVEAASTAIQSRARSKIQPPVQRWRSATRGDRWADHRAAVVLLRGAFRYRACASSSGLVGAISSGPRMVGGERARTAGSNLAYTRIKAEEAARMARAHKEVRFTFTTLGGSTGDVNNGNIYVRLVPKADRSIGAEDFGRLLRQEVGHIGGATMSVFTNDFQGAQKQIQIELRGGTSQELATTAELIAEQVKQVKGAVDVGLSTKGQKPELNVELNRGLAGTLGVTVGQVAQALRPAFAGIKAGLGRSDRRDTRGKCASRSGIETACRGPRATSPRRDRTRWSTENVASGPDRDGYAGPGSGADHPLEWRPGRDRSGEHVQSSADGSDEGHQRADREDHLPARCAHDAGWCRSQN